MAIGGAAAILVPAIQYGVPAAMQLVELGQKWLNYWQSDEAKSLTQEEFNAKWAEMQGEYAQATNKHQALQDQGR